MSADDQGPGKDDHGGIEDTAKEWLDKAKTYVGENSEKIEGGLDKARETISNVTKGKFDHQLDKGVHAAKDQLGKFGQSDDSTGE